MPDTETSKKLDELRDHLTEKLGELHRRATHAGHVLSPSTYWSQPWLRFGVGAAIGFALGRRPGTHESIVHAVVRAGLSAAAAMLVTAAMRGDP